MCAEHRVTFAALLFAAALPAQRAVLERLPQDAEAAQFRSLDFGDEFEPVTLPGAGPVRGLAFAGDTLWVRRGESLLAVDWKTKGVRQPVQAPASTCGLAADGRLLYMLRRSSIVVFDPTTAKETRTIDVATAVPPEILAVHGDSLFVLDRDGLVEVDPRTGQCKPGPRCAGALLQWITSDGTRLLGVDAVDLMDLGTGAGVRRWPGSLRNARGVSIDGRLLLFAESAFDDGSTPVCGLLPAHEAAKQPTLRVFVSGTGENLRCEFGGRVFASLDELQQELRRIAVDPRQREANAAGKSVPKRVEILASQGVLVRELTGVWRAVVTSGFPVVSCPAQEAWVRQQAKGKAPAKDGR